MILKQSRLETALGSVITLVDEEFLYLLEIEGRGGLDKDIEKLQKKTGAEIVPGSTPITALIEKELKLYFEGKLQTFKTPLATFGTLFQRRVWKELQKIPFGETRSYADIARILGRPTAFRAVAQANRSNRVAIVIPCHRVIYADGTLGGYAGGLEHKRWLLDHESKIV
ncbi:MAG: methylated-DNA--[protein]-cysteine S-methyltransferase [Chlamydiota bacterium]